jgi:glycosyltransferase involved in cell wall biosynthesis
MKIAIVSESTSKPSGFGQQAKLLAASLSDHGHDVNVLSFDHQKIPGNEKWKEFPCSIFSGPHIQHYLDKVKPDKVIFFGHAEFTGFLQVLANSHIAKHADCFFWIAWEAVTVPENLQKAYRCADKLVHLSSFAQKLWRDLDSKSIVIPHMVDKSVFRPLGNKEKLRAIWSRRLRVAIDPTGFVILCVDRNNTRKRYDLIFEAIRQLKTRTDDVQVIVHCQVSDRFGYDLKALAETYGVADSVVFTKFSWDKGITSDDLNELYNIADVRFSMSSGEGFGIPTIEAMAAGCVNVVPDNTTFAEIAGESAFFVPMIGHEVLFGKNLFVLHDPTIAAEHLFMLRTESKRQELREKGFARVKQYDVDTVTKKWLSVLANDLSDKERKAKFEMGFYKGTQIEKLCDFGKVVAQLSDPNKLVLDVNCGQGLAVDIVASLGVRVEGIFQNLHFHKYQSEIARLFCYVQSIEHTDFEDRYSSLLCFNLLDRWDEFEIVDFLTKVSRSSVYFLFVQVCIDVNKYDADIVQRKTRSDWELFFMDNGWRNRTDLLDAVTGLKTKEHADFFILERSDLAPGVLPEWVQERQINGRNIPG